MQSCHLVSLLQYPQYPVEDIRSFVKPNKGIGILQGNEPDCHPYPLLPPQYPTPYMPPVTIIPVMTKEMTSSQNAWLEDAPMPYDPRYAGSSTGYQEPVSVQQMLMQHHISMPPVMDPHHGYQNFLGQHPNYAMQYAQYDPRMQLRQVQQPLVVNSNIPDQFSLQRANVTPHKAQEASAVEEEKEPKEEMDKRVIEVHTEPHDKVPENRFKNEKKPWCSVHYYEYKRKSGNPYEAFQKSFTIDGTSPSSDENFFAISGQPDTKQVKCSQVRNQLGAGCRLDYRGGDVYMTILTDQAMFVQCRFLGELRRLDGLDTPIKLKNNQENKHSSGGEIVVKLFDKEKYRLEMEKAQEMSRSDAMEHLESFWSTRLSICKGYGEGYGNRPILQTPCWMEFQFTEPFEMADGLLRSHTVGVEEMNSRT